MKLSLTDEQQMIRDAARGFLADASDSSAVRRCAEGELGFDAAVWQQIAGELGWCGVGLPESAGGMGEDLLAQVLLIEAMGEHLLCAPYFGTVALAANLIASVGTQAAVEEWLPAIAEGRCTASVPLPSSPAWAQTAARAVSAVPVEGGWRLDGTITRAPEAARVDALLVFATPQDEEAPALFVLTGAPLTAVVWTTTVGWDATRRFADGRLDGLHAQRIDAPERMAAGLAAASARAQLCIAAEQLGAAQRCLDMTVAYLGERKQFGRTIASFQAVKHRCAQLMVEVETARSAVYGAAAVMAADLADAAAHNDALAARVLATETLFFAAQEAIQLHGGVGFTWEYDPHLYFKRAQASRHWLGTPDALRQQLAEALLTADTAAQAA